MSKRISFPSNWFTPVKINIIFTANGITSSPSGAENRMELVELLRSAIQDADKNGRLPNQPIGGEITISASWLRSWALGCLGAWTHESTNDRGRVVLRESCKALKCWEDLKKRLPAFEFEDFQEDEEDFQADQAPDSEAPGE